MTDPIVLAAQARPMLEKLHGHNDIVVNFKTDQSGYKEDATDDLDKAAPGHYVPGSKRLTLNLDSLITSSKPRPNKLDTIEDWREYPILAGVAAHESGHARWSRYDEIPDSIPNPGFDPSKPEGEGNREWFKVSGNGELNKLAEYLEEPRIERLGTGNFTKTWRRAMQLSAGHFITEKVTEMDENGENALDSAVRLAILVGGRQTAGTLGVSEDSRKAVKKILDSAQKIIETAVAGMEDPTPDPYHAVMGIINKEVFNNDHDLATSHLESARQILAIVHPETKDDPDSDPEGEGQGEGEGEGGEGSSGADPDGSLQKALAEMMEGVGEAVEDVRQEAESEADQPKDQRNESSGGHGATKYKNPRAPQMDRYDEPNKDDRELRKRASDWMEKQIEATVTPVEINQWLPTGGARLDVRAWVRDNMAGHKSIQRSDWTRVSETVKPAPPVKVAIMLDGSGSMGAYARMSASIAWAAANAAADLPESRTVSVVFGARAQVTQAPGHEPSRKVAVSNTDGPWENWIEAAEMVEETLWLDDDVTEEEGEKTNVLIIVVSDLMFGRDGQGLAFTKKTKEWSDKGFRILVVGPEKSDGQRAQYGVKTDNVDLVKPTDLFKA